jgi:hypothetical protein
MVCFHYILTKYHTYSSKSVFPFLVGLVYYFKVKDFEDGLQQFQKFLAELNFYAQKYPQNQVSSIFPSNPIFVSRRHSFVFPFVSRYSRRATYRQHG